MSYHVDYLPSFSRDLDEHFRYIKDELCAPIAAYNLVKAVYKAINERAEYPFSVRPFIYSRTEKIPYYCISVKNFYLLYTIKGDTIEMRFMIYNRRNIIDLI